VFAIRVLVDCNGFINLQVLECLALCEIIYSNARGVGALGIASGSDSVGLQLRAYKSFASDSRNAAILHCHPTLCSADTVFLQWLRASQTAFTATVYLRVEFSVSGSRSQAFALRSRRMASKPRQRPAHPFCISYSNLADDFSRFSDDDGGPSSGQA
jgi:hypothetical protein